MEAVVRVLLLIVVFLQSASAIAEENPISAHNKSLYGGVQKILLSAAERMPEEHYGFKPVDSVRSFGAILGHVADSQYIFCSRVRGEKNPALKIEQTKTSKADLISSLKDAFAYCDKAYEGMTDASAAEAVKMFGGDTPKIGILTVNEVHTIEHYGNLLTYMRMKGLVPPTSDPDFMKTLEPKR
jgi:uncharacterized damage-inducible protein DinB